MILESGALALMAALDLAFRLTDLAWILKQLETTRQITKKIIQDLMLCVAK